MSTNVTWNGVSYTIPASGELNWPTLSALLIALGTSAAVAEEMKQAMRVATTTPVTVSATTDFAVMAKLGSPGAVAVTLPAGVNGQIFVIGDQTGDAATNNITITPNGAETINGGATYVISDNRGSVILGYSTTNTTWNVLGRFTNGSVLTNPMATTGDMIYGGASGTPTKVATGSTAGLLHGGNAAVPSWSAASLTADVSGVLPMANGGTNKNMTAVNGGLVWSDTDSMEVTAAGTAGQWVLSGGAATPTMSNTTTTAKTIDGSADAIQLLVEGNATQTSDILDVRKSDGSTYLLQVTNVNGTAIRGTTTNDPAGTGFVAQYTVDSNATPASFPTTAQYGDMGSISLTAGDWDVCLIANASPNGATVTGWAIGIGTATGNSATGIVVGSTRAEGPGPTAAADTALCIPPVRVSLSATTIYYAKVRGTYSVATPQYTYRISARRVR